LLHPSEPFFIPLRLESNSADYEALQTKIARSRQAPYKQLSLAAGLIFTYALAALGALLRVLGKVKPDATDEALAAMYYNVPEMAVHKKIELEALATAGLSGHTLDIGCGNGIIMVMLQGLAPAIRSLHGVDALPIFDSILRERGYAGFTAADASAIPLPDASFDSAASICVLEHVQNLDGTMREIQRLLKPAGRLAFTTPAPEFRTSILAYRFYKFFGLNAKAEASAKARDRMSVQYHYYDPDTWTRALEALGFRDVRIEPLFSRRQLLAYEIMNFSVQIPLLYFADKLQIRGDMNGRFRDTAVRATATVTAWIANWRVRSGQHTHWFITAAKA
jgi:ubiquinone/menaquinone biosynthesis C-methylase UbiE